MKAFLMIGQSNMAGRGDFGEVEEIRNPLCKMLRNARWQPMSEPINPDRSPFIFYHSGVGLAASFADEYAKHFGEMVGLIPCADGGTSIREWQPNGALFANAVAQCKLALQYADAEIVGILWHQGESDCDTEEHALTYYERFMTMIHALRREIGLSDDVPVLIGELGEYLRTFQDGKLIYLDKVNETLHRISEDLPCASFVSAKGLLPKSDGLHFNSESYREFGKRYFKASLSLFDKECSSYDR